MKIRRTLQRKNHPRTGLASALHRRHKMNKMGQRGRGQSRDRMVQHALLFAIGGGITNLLWMFRCPYTFRR
ncbi:hypothetical protein DMH17_12825 [Raoultella planticola]|nr:hypothetical protein [Raoultella planticola]